MKREFANRVVVLVIASMLLIPVAPASAFVLDTHYYTTFVLSLSMCFDWEESHLIASGAFQLDRNKITKAEINPARQYNKRYWHSFSHDQARLNELWRRALDQTDPKLQLIQFGQFLHFVQDWESHARYPLTIGHAIPSAMGRDPDSLAQNQNRTDRMMQATLDHLGKMCVHLGRAPDGLTDADFAMVDFYEKTRLGELGRYLVETSDPGWRSRFRGKITRKGRRIVQENRTHIERYIERYIERSIAPYPDAKVPADFEPGNPEKGIPDSLVLRLDKDGNLMHSVDAALTGLPDSEPFDDWEDDDWVEVKKVVEIEGGVRVDLVMRNHDQEASPKGIVTMFAVDLDTEEVVAEAEARLPRVKAGGRLERRFDLLPSRVPDDYLIGLAFDFSQTPALSGEFWIMTKQDLEELTEEVEQGERSVYGSAAPGELKAIEFVEPPKSWVTPGGSLCLDIEARTNLDDPTEELNLPQVFLVRTDQATPPLEGRVEGVVWSVSAQEEGDLAGATTFDCYDPRDQICGLVAEEYEPWLDIQIRAETIVQRRRITIPEDRLERLAAACERIEK